MIELSQRMDSPVTVLWELSKKTMLVIPVLMAAKPVLHLMSVLSAHFRRTLRQMGLALAPQPTTLRNKSINCYA